MARRKGSSEGKRLRDFPKKKEEKEEEDAILQPDWEYSSDISPSFRGLVLKILALVKTECKAIRKKLELFSLPTGEVDLLESHRHVCSTVLKRAQEGAPFQLPLKSLRAINAGAAMSEAKLKKIATDQRGFGITEPTDTEDKLTELATLKRMIGDQRDVFEEDRQMETAGVAE